MRLPLVSVITITYNHGRFIGQCIESVINQTYPNWEHIIIDDGSTDGTAEVVARFKDKRVKYIRQNNLGIWRLAETYNKALRIAQGELIAVLEGDDYWPPHKLEKQVPVFSREDVVFSWGMAGFVDAQGKLIRIAPRDFKRLRDRPRGELVRKLFLENIVQSATVMCRKSALLSIGGFKQPESAPYCDYPTWLELSLVGDVELVDDILGYWRHHGGQVSVKQAYEMAFSDNYPIGLFKRMPQEVRDLTGLSMKELEANERHCLALGHLRVGRILLNEGKWGGARKQFQNAFLEGKPSTKLFALLGMVCSYFRVDLEWAAVLLRRPRLT